MKVKLNAFHEIKEEDLPKDSVDPIFRKATSNMVAALSVCQKALASLNQEQKDSLSLVVSTQFGEVTSSLEFLTTFYDTKVAKPILFQNSLHNSTLGFVTIQLGLTGPALTLSSDERMDESISETTAGLLSMTSHVLVCQVDMVPDFVKENYAVAYPQLKNHLGWARAFIISKAEAEVNGPVLEKDLFHFKYSEDLSDLQVGLRV